MKKTTISVSVELRNRIKHARNVTFNKTYETFLRDLMDRDKLFQNEEKIYTNKGNVLLEVLKLRKQRKSHIQLKGGKL